MTDSSTAIAVVSRGKERMNKRVFVHVCVCCYEAYAGRHVLADGAHFLSREKEVRLGSIGGHTP